MLTERIGTSAGGRARTDIGELLHRIRCEYREMPGLCLTEAQAGRLWGLDNDTCTVVLTTLVEQRVLRQTAVSTYVRGPAC